MNNLKIQELKKKNEKRYLSPEDHSFRYQMTALSSSLLWFLGGLRKLSGLLMDQGHPRRCGCL